MGLGRGAVALDDEFGIGRVGDGRQDGDDGDGYQQLDQREAALARRGRESDSHGDGQRKMGKCCSV